MTSSQEKHASLVAFGGYRCNCTMVAADFTAVPDRCPTHAAGLLGPVDWVENTHAVPMGLEAATSPNVPRQASWTPNPAGEVRFLGGSP